MANFNGKWILEESENFEEFLKAMNVEEGMAQALAQHKPQLEIEQKGNDFVIRTQGPSHVHEQCFAIGQVFQQSNPFTGEMRKGVAFWDGGKLVLKPGAQYAKEAMATHEKLGSDKMAVTLQVGNVSARRVFSKASP